MATITLSSEGYIILPKAYRDSLGWGAGQVLNIVDAADGSIVLRAVKTSRPHLTELVGSGKRFASSDPVDRVREERENWER